MVLFEELDFRATSLGILSLRRRRYPGQHSDTYEIKLGDEFLMSSQFTDAEVALARLGLAALDFDGLDVLVGGLGLGHTAAAVLGDSRVRSLLVVEALPEVIEWHRAELLPLSADLAADPRCRLAQGDFFALCGDQGKGFAGGTPVQRFHAVLVDIDHSPDRVLHPSHTGFYGAAGLARLLARLNPGGVFALWSDDPPDAEFLATLQAVFFAAEVHIVRFASMLNERELSNSIYVARRGN
ncbi:hypothetical protein [Falsiroseomonas sp. E2-1-a20]|uniref:hypothetical protein n=1 Tax=Falsiroseomonas sp. E2-1-a20 TaxID=3239300 RepID=UPI003F355124